MYKTRTVNSVLVLLGPVAVGIFPDTVIINNMESKTIRTALECDKDGTWYYAHIPKEVRDSYKAYGKRGSIRVTATVGATSWGGSMLP